jgi:hypothetical protein
MQVKSCFVHIVTWRRDIWPGSHFYLSSPSLSSLLMCPLVTRRGGSLRCMTLILSKEGGIPPGDPTDLFRPPGSLALM